MNNYNNKMPNNPFMNMQLMQIKRTPGVIRFTFAVMLGILPLLICAMFISPNDINQVFKQWGEAGIQTKVTVDYGLMWLIGFAVYISSLLVTTTIVKYVKGISIDVVPITAAAGLAMMNMFVIPHSSQWWLLLSLPSFWLIGYIVGIFIMLVSSIKVIQSEILKMQDNGENPFENTILDKQNSKKKSDINKKQLEDFEEGNPFVDVEEDEE